MGARDLIEQDKYNGRGKERDSIERSLANVRENVVRRKERLSEEIRELVKKAQRPFDDLKEASSERYANLSSDEMQQWSEVLSWCQVEGELCRASRDRYEERVSAVASNIDAESDTLFGNSRIMGDAVSQMNSLFRRGRSGSLDEMGYGDEYYNIMESWGLVFADDPYDRKERNIAESEFSMSAEVVVPVLQEIHEKYFDLSPRERLGIVQKMFEDIAKRFDDYASEADTRTETVLERFKNGDSADDVAKWLWGDETTVDQ